MITLTAKEILLKGELLSNHFIEVTEGHISRTGPISALQAKQEISDLGNVTIFPGLFDIQVNGGGGILFNDTPTVKALKNVSSAHKKFGTTAFLPTLITDDFSVMTEMANAVDCAIKNNLNGIKGIHFEGPFLNPERKGVHNSRHMALKEAQFLTLLDRFELGSILVTLAPEMVSSNFIRELVRKSVKISAGHTAATFEQTIAAINEGLTGFTHLFNAMPPLLSREPGVIGAAFQTKQTYAGLIADGHHIHPAVLTHALKTLGKERAILVSDAMPCSASDLKHFKLGDLDVTVEDKKCITSDGTLAGSAITLSDAVTYCINQLQFSAPDTFRMASLTPSQFMGLDHLQGSIEIGKAADFVSRTVDGEIRSIDLSLY